MTTTQQDLEGRLWRAANALRGRKHRFPLMRVQSDAAELLPKTDPQQAEALSEALELAASMGATVITERLAAATSSKAAAGA